LAVDVVTRLGSPFGLHASDSALPLPVALVEHAGVLNDHVRIVELRVVVVERAALEVVTDSSTGNS
jgi:hypothetical protein